MKSLAKRACKSRFPARRKKAKVDPRGIQPTASFRMPKESHEIRKLPEDRWRSSVFVGPQGNGQWLFILRSQDVLPSGQKAKIDPRGLEPTAPFRMPKESHESRKMLEDRWRSSILVGVQGNGQWLFILRSQDVLPHAMESNGFLGIDPPSQRRFPSTLNERPFDPKDCFSCKPELSSQICGGPRKS